MKGATWAALGVVLLALSCGWGGDGKGASAPFALTPVVETEAPLTGSTPAPGPGQAAVAPDAPTGRGGEQEAVAVASPVELAQALQTKVFLPLGYPIDEILYLPKPEEAQVRYVISFLRSTAHLHVLWPAPADPSRYEDAFSFLVWGRWTVTSRDTVAVGGKGARLVLLEERGVPLPWRQTLLLWESDGYLLGLVGRDTTPFYPRATTETVLRAAQSVRGFSPAEIGSAPWQMRSPEDRATSRPRRYESPQQAARESGLTIYVPSRARVEWVVVAQVEDPPDSGNWFYHPLLTTVMLEGMAMLDRRAGPPDASQPPPEGVRREALTVNGAPAFLDTQPPGTSPGGRGSLQLRFSYRGEHFVLTAPVEGFDRARLVAIAESLQPVTP